jgi:hypothetical protein
MSLKEVKNKQQYKEKKQAANKEDKQQIKKINSK